MIVKAVTPIIKFVNADNILFITTKIISDENIENRYVIELDIINIIIE